MAENMFAAAERVRALAEREIDRAAITGRELRALQRGRPIRVSEIGWREPRAIPLVDTDLWMAGVGPAPQLPHSDQDHHECGLCTMVKSHPVSYVCGHSHCYVCVRLWLEEHWTCPQCAAPMNRAPFRHWGEEASIAVEYLDWKDESAVNYSWEGLTFPQERVMVRPPRIIVPASP
ncbi:hypothetical protein C8R45DRAFT_1108192 [Mycena sanguinolenta]|nr:hypothetical protein C8R45DRAFT_1108192 [Mycena sanguinolenta]